MRNPRFLPNTFYAAVMAIALLSLPIAAAAQSRHLCGTLWPCEEPPAELDEFFAIVEINATDGDAGFHALFDADAWAEVMLVDSNGTILVEERASGGLVEQGLTENFFESAEPLCEPDPEEPDEEVVTLAEFLARFPEGEYMLTGETVDGDFMLGMAEFTYDIPAAPDIGATEDAFFAEGQPVVISWAPGSDLGEKCHDQSLVDDGTISDPGAVEIVRWEVVVEPEDEEAADPLRVFSVHLPPGQTSMTVPDDFFTQYLEDGYNVFKFEVGGREESGNQTFSEGEFEIECPECGEDEDDDE